MNVKAYFRGKNIIYLSSAAIYILKIIKDIHCGYSLETPHQGMFSWTNKVNINIFWLEKASYLDLWICRLVWIFAFFALT